MSQTNLLLTIATGLSGLTIQTRKELEKIGKAVVNYGKEKGLEKDGDICAKVVTDGKLEKLLIDGNMVKNAVQALRQAERANTAGIYATWSNAQTAKGARAILWCGESDKVTAKPTSEDAAIEIYERLNPKAESKTELEKAMAIAADLPSAELDALLHSVQSVILARQAKAAKKAEKLAHA